MRQLLIDTFPITSTGLRWEVRCWDGQRFHFTHHPPGYRPELHFTRIRRDSIGFSEVQRSYIWRKAL